MAPELFPFEADIASERAFVFPGQGAQSVGMGKDIYDAYPYVRELYQRADEVLGFSLSTICFEGPAETLLQTENTQPALVVTSLAYLLVAFRENEELRKRPGYVAGHSLGEYAALVAAGSLSFEDAVRLVRMRGLLMSKAGEANPGTMAAVLGLEVADCEAVCREAGAEICNINAPGQIVIGGRHEAVVRAMDYARARGATKVIPLSVSGAFHSSLMQPASDGMVQHVATAEIAAPEVPIVGNCHAALLGTEQEIRHELVDQVCRPVQWANIVDFLHEAGVETYIEFGPGRVLSGIIRRMYRRSKTFNVNSAESVQLGL